MDTGVDPGDVGPVMVTLGGGGAAIEELHGSVLVTLALSVRVTENENAPGVVGVPELTTLVVGPLELVNESHGGPLKAHV